MLNKIKRWLVPYLLLLLVLNIVWVIVGYHFLSRDYIKTTGIVISLTGSPASESFGSQDSTYANYSYTDQSGHNHIYNNNDGFNFFTKLFFGAKVGDKHTLFYSRTNPGNDVVLAYGGNWLTVVFAPLFLGTFIPAVALLTIYVLRQRLGIFKR